MRSATRLAMRLALSRTLVVRTAAGVVGAVAGATPLLAQPAAPAAQSVAQQGTIAGTVVRAGTLTPVDGAQVQVRGTRLGTATDAAGRFRIPNVPGAPGATVTLQVRRISFQPASVEARVGATDVRVVLGEATVRLDEVVVTGTAGATERRALGNAVATISAPEEVERSGIGDVGSLINGRATGVIVTAGTGRAGSGPSINIRGRSTISLSQQPLVYIDGVRVVNDIGTGPRNQGGAQISRLNDISPEDIESIEIIKGPAAATIYGTEASNGVVQIITRKGRMGGPPQLAVSLRQGGQWFMDAEGRIPTNYARDPRSGEVLSWNAVAQENARGTPLWETGRLQSYNAGLSGGSPLFRYNVSTALDRDQGIEPNNRLTRFTGLMNLTATPNDRVDVASTLNIVRGKTHLGSDYGYSTFWAALYGSPLTAATPTRGFNIAPPEVAWTQFDNTQDISRYTGSAQLTHRPVRWFNQRLIVGLDQTTEDNQALSQFLPDQYRQFFAAAAARGSLLQDLRNITFLSGDYNGTATFALSPAISSATSVGGQYYRKRFDVVQVSGREFPAPGLRTAAAAALRDGGQDYQTNTTIGLYVQQQFALRDRLFLTGAVRVDNNSAFGEEFDLATYPKLSASWVVSEEPFWKSGPARALTTLKLRSAFGVSGQQPDAFAALRTFQPVTGSQDQPAVTPQFVGNAELRPERGVEFEAGFEAGLYDRVSVDFTYFAKRTRDAILLRPVAPSLGFPGAQFVNIGEVSNRGVELGVRAQLVARERVGWESTVNLGTARDRIEDLGGIPFIAIPGLPQRHVEGYPIGGYWARRVVSADVAPSGAVTNILCDGGAENGGRPLPCGAAPALFQGTITPTLTGAVGNTVTLGRNLRLYALVDFQRGHRLLDTDAVIRCAIFRVCDVNVRPQDFAPQYVGNAQLGSGLQVVDRFIHDASFAKLREVSVGYTLPGRLAGRAGAERATLTLAGRNLHTWTRFPGLDPERRSLIAQIGQLDQAVTPMLAQFVATLNLTF